MAIVNKIIHRFIRHRDDYMDPTKELYNQIIPYNVQAYSYELKPNGDPNIPDDYIIRYVLGTGRSTYQQIADGQGKDADGNAIPELSKEFVLNSNTQLIKIITDLIESQVIASSYITSDIEGNPFPTKASLLNAEAWYNDGQSVLPKKNDYVIVTADETHPTGTGDPQTAKYVCVGITSNNKPVWNYQYIINNGNFTPEQQAAIDSGITAEKVALYDSYAAKLDELTNHITDYNNPHKVTAEQIGLGNVDNTSDIDKPISTATQEALDSISEDLTAHTENADIHVTVEEKTSWTNKQDTLKMGNHIKISNNVISVDDDLSGYNNSISQFVNKSTTELENYYTKDELKGLYNYQGEVATYEDLPTGNIYAPNTYRELQYLTADQLEYIDTNYHPNTQTEILLKFRINGEGNNYLYGTDIEHETNKVAFGINYGTTTARALFGKEGVLWEIDDQPHVLIQNKNGVYLDNIRVSTYTNIEEFITDSSLWLFRAQQSDTHPENISIYEVEIREREEVVRHYIPVKRIADDALGLYEVLSEEFKQNEYNLEEFDFIPGPVAGYGNKNGIVYKVLSDDTFYMWYEGEWIDLGGSGGVIPDGITIVKNPDKSISTVGVKTKSDTIMYDWIGTLAEWEAGRLAGTIPDNWICWITDDEEEPAGVANLAKVASTGIFEDLKNIPELPSDKIAKNYLLLWNHLTQQFEWIETDLKPQEGEYDPITHTLTIPDCDWGDGILVTDHIIPISEGGEYDPVTETLTVSDAEWEDKTLTTSSIVIVDDEDEYDPITHMLAIGNIVYSDNTLITNQIQPMENM